MTSYYVFSALAAQRENEIERQAALARQSRARARAADVRPDSGPLRPRGARWRHGWRRPRHLLLG